jgi:dTDP-4-amino-4,6-dideoxy-D-galactose acyltransferase
VSASDAGRGSAPCEVLPWDSDHFGFTIGRVTASRLDGGAADAALRWCEERDVACLYLQVDSVDAGTTQVAEERGFRLVDVRAELVRPLEVQAAPGATGGAHSAVRPFGVADAPPLEALARSAFSDTRFFRDPGFPRQRSEELYVKWLRAAIEAPGGDAVLVADEGTGASGFITVTLHRDSLTGEVGLVAVSQQSRREGVGAALVQSACKHCAAQGMKRVRVATQAHNVPALRLYERLGFRTNATMLWFHRWF